MDRQDDQLAALPVPGARRRGPAATHPAARRGLDPLRAVPRVGPGAVGSGGEPPFLKAIPGTTVGARAALPGPVGNAATALAAPPGQGALPALGAMAAVSGPKPLLALPKPAAVGASGAAGGGVIPMRMDPRPRALPPGTGQIDLGMDADAGVRSVPRGAPGTPAETPPRGYEGVNWGPQNPKPGPNEMGATMGAYDRLNQARAASAAAGGGATPSPAQTPEPGAWGKATAAANLLLKGAKGLPGVVAGFAENQLSNAAYRGQTPGWVQALEQDAEKVGEWAQRGIPMTQEDFLAALPAQHEKILAQRGTTEKPPAAAGGAQPAEKQADVAQSGGSAGQTPAAADPLADAPPVRLEWAGADSATTGAPRSAVPQRDGGEVIKPVMTDEDMADYRAMLAEQDAAQAAVTPSAKRSAAPAGGKSLGAGQGAIRAADGRQWQFDGKEYASFDAKGNLISRRPAEAAPDAQSVQAALERSAAATRYMDQVRAAERYRSDLSRAAEYRDPAMRAALGQAARDVYQATTGGLVTDRDAGGWDAQKALEQTRTVGATERERVQAQGRVAEKQAEARKPVVMKYKVGAKQPGGEPLDQEVLVDPLTRQPLFDTAGSAAGGGGEHPFGAYEDRPAAWDKKAKEKRYPNGQKAYEATVAAWKQQYGQGGA